MKTIKLGSQEVGIKGTPLSLLFYKQEFKSDLVGDLVKLGSALKKSEENIDMVLLLQITWAMAKTATGVGKQFPNFEKWLDSLDGFDCTNQELMFEILGEARNGFFRSGGEQPPIKQ